MREPGHEISADVFFSSYIWSRFPELGVSVSLGNLTRVCIFIGKQEQGWMHRWLRSVNIDTNIS